jgi:hypothetical protein
MTTPSDAYWDELGIAWCAINPDVDVIAARLKLRLRRQSLLITAGLVVGLSLSVAGFLLGVFTIWLGWTSGAWNFLTRGIALMAIALIVAVAASVLRPARASDGARALSEMIDLAITRAERILQTIRLGFYACAVAAVLGIVGAAIRTYLGKPPALSPIIDLAALAICALGLHLWSRHAKTTLAKFRYLKHALAVERG